MMGLAALWCAGGVLVAAGPFEAPREGPIPFRRDLLPLDADTLNHLSVELLNLAEAQPQETAENRRSIARTLALALAVQPGNLEARDAISAFSEGRAPTSAGAPASPLIARVLPWLQSPDAGEAGAALAACLQDVVSPTAPEKGAWGEWVADLSKFEAIEAVDKEEVANVSSNTKPAPGGILGLRNAAISTPVRMPDPVTRKLVMAPVRVKMETILRPPTASGAPASLEVTVTTASTYRVDPMVVSAILTGQFGKSPHGYEVILKVGEDGEFLESFETVSAAAYVLVAASVSGREPVGTVIGSIDPQGKFIAGPDFWIRLRSLSKGPGGRLVVPAETAELLPEILALEDPEFFMKYEVLLADNFEQLLDRTAALPTGNLGQTLEKFQAIRARGSSLPIGQHLSNRLVRQQLGELAMNIPYFVSPRLLAVQGAGERPTRISRKILAYELRQAIEPMKWIFTKTQSEIHLPELDQSYEICREAIDGLARYVDTTDRDFQNQARDMATTLRTFSRASRARPEVSTAAFRAMVSSYGDLIQEIGMSAGEMPREDLGPSPFKR